MKFHRDGRASFRAEKLRGLEYRRVGRLHVFIASAPAGHGVPGSVVSVEDSYEKVPSSPIG
ncbi:hypothetical protein SAMD00023353_0402050 [Rosellinia necatrix]|uniref:Uncharacterized protein n=1 Tax=Rosellinia necatrix TaxID=77044 RepID=A0A1S8A5H9_ROSNE|nr:hypothetical protein SAMD00023353_0402050 [Rosellinia necatrix]